VHIDTEPIARLQIARQKLIECEHRIAEYEKYQQTGETRQMLSEVLRKWEAHRAEIAELQKQIAEQEKVE
jgi:hypothetical protein